MNDIDQFDNTQVLNDINKVGEIVLSYPVTVAHCFRPSSIRLRVALMQ